MGKFFSARWCFVFVLSFLLISPFFSYAQKAATTPKTVLDFKDELKLSDSQAKEIRAIIADFEKKVEELQKKLVFFKNEATGLLKKDGDFKDVKKNVKGYHDTMAELEIANLEAGRKIRQALTAEQFKMWKEIAKSAEKTK